MKQIQTSLYLKFIISAAILLLLLGCKSAKSVMASGTASDKVSAKQVIKEHEKNAASFKTLQAKVRIDIIQGDKEQGLTFNFRMEKDKVIWLSAPFGLARMMITPENVWFYNKSDNTFFEGDYELLSDFVGVPLDFNKVQNILLGQAIFNLRDQAHRIAVYNKSYALQPKNQSDILELIYLINPSHFRMDSMQMAQQLEKRLLQVDYTSYQEVTSQIIPKYIKVVAVEDSEEVAITMEFKSVSLNEELRFPFKMPSGYKEIIIKKL